ncbi:MAG TPA: aminotransferase class V-fold PLP-dependent enzyme [Gemmatimonadales bacterium]|nr:aminotransferase class V-fold PLP-dependent enzyme [Gemmatimonadales bacterium]
MAAWFSPDYAELSDATRAAIERGSNLASAAVADVIQLAQPDLRRLFRTGHPVSILAGDHALAREITLRSVVEQRILVLIAGPESAALAEASRSLGHEVIELRVHPGTVPEPEHLRRFLAKPDVDTVALCATELSHGTQLPLRELAAVARTHPELVLLVDATGALGATPIEMDAWDLDVVLSPSRGPLGLPPGFSLAGMSSRAVTRARKIGGRGARLDLLAHRTAAERGEVLTSMAPALVLALRQQLEHILTEGLEARWSRHAMLRATVEQWVMVRNDLHPLAPSGQRADAATSLRLPPGSSAQRVITGLADDDWPIAPDALRLPDDRLCIGHMGETSEPDLLRLLEAIGRQLDLGR